MDCSLLDTAREVRLECMRRQSRSAQVLRRHEDLRKQYERQVRLYEKAQRLMSAQCQRSHARCQEHLYSHLFLTVRRVPYPLRTADRGQAPASTRAGSPLCGLKEAERSKLLFRVQHRGGKDVYIRDCAHDDSLEFQGRVKPHVAVGKPVALNAK